MSDLIEKKTEETPEDPPALFFAVDGQIIGELGVRLVSNNYIALAELIKNAYDADSREVTVNLINARGDDPDSTPTIRIHDNGHGMTFDEIDDHWMRIATANKLASPTSPRYGRPKTGNKGIGRFSCQKLAKTLVLKSVAKKGKSYEHTEVTFNWDAFEPGKDLARIPSEYVRSLKRSGKTGVTLELKALRELWTPRDFKMLQKNVSVISTAGKVKRAGFREDPGFNVILESKDFSEKPFALSDELLTAGWGTLRGYVGDDGSLRLELESKASRKEQHTVPEYDHYLAGVRFEIHMLPGTKTVENRRKPTLLTKTVREALAEESSGIRLYMNRFRVYPYGDPPDDWLGVAKDVSRRRGSADDALLEVSRKLGERAGFDYSRAMLNHPAATALFGSVHIEGHATQEFEAYVKMDREGLSDSERFSSLKKAVRIGLDWATLHYEAFLRSELARHSNELSTVLAGDSKSESLALTKRVRHAVSIVRDVAGDASADDASSDHSKDSLRAAADVLDNSIDVFEQELGTLRAIAATAPLMFVFSHEVRGIIAGLVNHSERLRNMSRAVSDSKHSTALDEMSKDAKASIRRYTDLLNLFDVFSDSQSFDAKPAKFGKTVTQVVKGFDFLFQELGIDVSINKIPASLSAKNLNEAALYSIVINLVSNAVKALLPASGKRRLHIDIEKGRQWISIDVLDTGVGISKSNRDRVFEPFVRDPDSRIYAAIERQFSDPSLAVLGKGSGLGLHIVRGILEDAGGSVSIVDAPPGWKTCFHVVIPN